MAEPRKGARGAGRGPTKGKVVNTPKKVPPKPKPKPVSDFAKGAAAPSSIFYPDALTQPKTKPKPKPRSVVITNPAPAPFKPSTQTKDRLQLAKERRGLSLGVKGIDPTRQPKQDLRAVPKPEPRKTYPKPRRTDGTAGRELGRQSGSTGSALGGILAATPGQSKRFAKWVGEGAWMGRTNEVFKKTNWSDPRDFLDPRPAVAAFVLDIGSLGDTDLQDVMLYGANWVNGSPAETESPDPIYGAISVATALPWMRGLGGLAKGLKTGFALKSVKEAQRAADEYYQTARPLVSTYRRATGKSGIHSRPSTRVFEVNDLAVGIEAGESRLSRAVEGAADTLRTGKSTMAKAGKEVRRKNLTRTRVLQEGVPGLQRHLKRLGGSIDADAKIYALRLALEKTPPKERAQFHLDKVKEATNAGDSQAVAYHAIHANLASAASRYVDVTPNGVVWGGGRNVDLTEAYRLITDITAPNRERMLKTLGVLTDAQIRNRAEAPARVIAGAEWKPYEEIFQRRIRINPSREEFILEVMRMEGVTREVAESTADAMTQQMKLRSQWNGDTPEQTIEAVDSMWNKIRGFRHDTDGQGINPAYWDRQLKLGEEDMPTDVLLNEIQQGPSPETKAHYAKRARALMRRYDAKHLPEGARTPSKLRDLLLELRGRALEAELYKRWYATSAAAILREAGGDEQKAIRLAMLFSIYSPLSAVWDPSEWNNTTRAIGAFDEWVDNGMKPGSITDRWSLSKGGDTRDWQTEAANAAMDEMRWQGEGRKTSAFAYTFIRYINPEMAREIFGDIDPAVIDTWMRRAFKYARKPGSKKPKGYIEGQEGLDVGAAADFGAEPVTTQLGPRSMFSFMEDSTREIADELGWSIDEAQAAIWTSIKAEQEGTALSAAGTDFSHGIKDVRAQQTLKAQVQELPLDFDTPFTPDAIVPKITREIPTEENYERLLRRWAADQMGRSHLKHGIKGGKKKMSDSQYEGLLRDALKFYERNPGEQADAFFELYYGARPVAQTDDIPFHEVYRIDTSGEPEYKRATSPEEGQAIDDYIAELAEKNGVSLDQVYPQRAMEDRSQDWLNAAIDDDAAGPLKHEVPKRDPYVGKKGTDLEGLPGPVKVDGQEIQFHSFKPAQDIAEEYTREAGIDYKPPTKYTEVNEERATKIAQWYDSAKHSPDNQFVALSYQAFIEETMAQFQKILDTGITVRLSTNYPYDNPRKAVLDVVENNNLVVYPSAANMEEFLPGHPLIAKSGYVDADGNEWLYNDVFRFVHDYFGHVKDGVGFRAAGEDAAWKSHSAMYSPLARPAMTTETRGQNSWVNYGPHGATNRTAQQGGTVYPPQKAAIAPEWAMETIDTKPMPKTGDAVVISSTGERGYVIRSKEDGTIIVRGENGEKFTPHVDDVEVTTPGVADFTGTDPTIYTGPEGSDVGAFGDEAAQEIQDYAAMARDIAKTLPEEEWPAWVRNQIRRQSEADLGDIPTTGEDDLQSLLRDARGRGLSSGNPMDIMDEARAKGFDPEDPHIKEGGKRLGDVAFAIDEVAKHFPTQATWLEDALTRWLETDGLALDDLRLMARSLWDLNPPQESRDAIERLSQAIDALDAHGARGDEMMRYLDSPPPEYTQSVGDDMGETDMLDFEFALPPEARLFTSEEAAALNPKDWSEYVFHGTDPVSAEKIWAEKRLRLGTGRAHAAEGLPPHLFEPSAFTAENPRIAARYADGRTYDRGAGLPGDDKSRGMVIAIPKSALPMGTQAAGNPYGTQNAIFGGETFSSPDDILFNKALNNTKVMGAAEFGQDGAFTLHYAEDADVETFVHEVAHWMRRNMTPKQQKSVARMSGARKRANGEYVWTREAEEKFVALYMKMIHGGTTPPAFKAAIRPVREAMKKVIKGGNLPDMTPHQIDLFRKVFADPKPLGGGKFVGAEDLFAQSNLVPTYVGYRRGIPASHNLHESRLGRTVGSYARMGREALFGGGRGRAVGAGPVDKRAAKTFKAGLLSNGEFASGVEPTVEDVILASRMRAAFEARKELLAASQELPTTARDIPIKVDPKVNTSPELKRLYDLMTGMTDEMKWKEGDLKGLNLEAAFSITGDLFPGIIDGRSASEVAAEVIETLKPVPNIRWVSPEFVDHTGLLATPPSAGRLPENQQKVADAIGIAFDSANDLGRAMLTYFNPAYVPMNLAGNLTLMMLHQGVFAPVNLYRAGMMYWTVAPETRTLIDSVMGTGFAENVGFRADIEAVQRGVATIGHVMGIAIDMLPRRAAFLHEAAREGFKGDDLVRLMKRKDEEAIDIIHRIRDRAADKMVDFERMTEFEKRYVSRFILFYPWIRGASRTAAKLAMDRPYEMAALLLVYDYAKTASDEELGQRPTYAAETYPISTKSVGIGLPFTDKGIGLDDLVGERTWKQGQNPMTINIRQLFPLTTPKEIADQIMDIREGKASWVENLQPLMQSAITAGVGYDTFYDKKVDKGFGTFLDQMFGQAPLPTAIKRVAKSDEQREEDNKSRLNPRTRLNEILRVFGGSPTPQPYNPVIGQRSVAFDEGDAGEAYVLDITRKASAAGFPEPPPQIKDAARWRGRLDAALEGKEGRDRAEAALKVFVERFPDRAGVLEFLDNATTEDQYDTIVANTRKYLYPNLNAYERALKKAEGSR